MGEGKTLCSFTIAIGNHNASELILAARTEIEKHGGKLSGDQTSGEFSIPSPAVEGAYTINETDITFIITKKPWIATCGMIESKLKQYLGK